MLGSLSILIARRPTPSNLSDMAAVCAIENGYSVWECRCDDARWKTPRVNGKINHSSRQVLGKRAVPHYVFGKEVA